MFSAIISKSEIHTRRKFLQGWVRKQTLVGAERYITEELKEYETKILGAEEKDTGAGNPAFQRTGVCAFGIYPGHTAECRHILARHRLPVVVCYLCWIIATPGRGKRRYDY
jgi:hypothetical protein